MLKPLALSATVGIAGNVTLALLSARMYRHIPRPSLPGAGASAPGEVARTYWMRRARVTATMDVPHTIGAKRYRVNELLPPTH
jgi:hypothetical protein